MPCGENVTQLLAEIRASYISGGNMKPVIDYLAMKSGIKKLISSSHFN